MTAVGRPILVVGLVLAFALALLGGGTAYVAVSGGDLPGDAIDGALAGVLGDGASGHGADEHAIAFVEVSNRTGFDYAGTGGGTTSLSDVGLYAGDANGDGRVDLLATGGPEPALFVNRNGSFTRSNRLPRLDRRVRSALFLDADADGDEDLLVLSDGRVPLLLENRGGRFRAVEAGFERALGVPIGATAGDYNRDGCLDVFVVQNGPWGDRIPKGLEQRTVPFDDDNGLPNVLYRGTCSGFERVTGAGIAGTRWSLATSFVDLTGDGWPDIHVANDFNNDVVYRNRHDGTFEQVVLGEATDRNGMASEVADVNRDGRPDLFVTNIYYPEIIAETIQSKFVPRAKGNNLLINRGNATFSDEAARYGVRRGGWGWAAVVADLDNDADQDLYHATMRRTFDASWQRFSDADRRRIRREHPYFRYPVLRERNGSTFQRRSALAAGLGTHDGTAVVSLDFDGDGDLDLAVANRSGPFRLYENRLPAHCQSVTVRVRSAPGERPVVGSRVTLTTPGPNRTRFLTSRTDFLSQDSRTIHFGTGGADRVSFRVQWPDGTVRRFEDVRPGATIVVTPGGQRRRPYRGCDAGSA